MQSVIFHAGEAAIFVEPPFLLGVTGACPFIHPPWLSIQSPFFPLALWSWGPEKGEDNQSSASQVTSEDSSKRSSRLHPKLRRQKMSLF